LNKDVGFVRVNQEVVVKLEAYPFTRFGYLSGIVETVSADAIIDQQRGLVYPVRIRITSNDVKIPGMDGVKPASLSPGMVALIASYRNTKPGRVFVKGASDDGKYIALLRKHKSSDIEIYKFKGGL
jgi:multidrug efflux pump subunit AcrA (membrane-fusion protein)